MWILVISIIAFAVIMFILNLIDKNKEKLEEKLKLEKKEVMVCPKCFNEYEDLSLNSCNHCDTSLNRKIKYKIPKKLKQKIIFITLGIILIIAMGIGAYLGISNYIKEQKRVEKYNNDITTCYEIIKNESDFNKFASILNEHTEEVTFSIEAYRNLYKAVDERIENIKNGNDDDKLISMLKEIKKEKSKDEKLEERYLKATSYSNINKVNKQIEEQKYQEAYDLLGQVITDNKDKNQDIVDIATNKQNEIKDRAFEQVIAKAQEKMNNKEYYSAQTTLSKYKDLGNQTILDMYNNATNEVNRIEAEKKAKEEAEERARQEEERKRKQAELDAKKDKITINKNGKKIWKVCMTGNTFRFEAKYRGNGNFIVKLLDDNQDLEELICNEIGDYNVDKTVRVTKGAYYYIETYVSDGSWNGTWWGTYGD